MWRVLFLVVVFKLSECKVRLAGGSSSSEGRVEIFHNGKWGTICDDDWGIDDARVVCRSLGLPDAIGATALANYGGGSGEIWLDGVQCRGNEMSLADCRHDGWGANNCGHGEDAGVVCGHPNVVNINVSSLSGVITSPGYPLYMQRANYEWTFRPTTPNTNVFVCFEDLDLRTYSKGSFRATVEDSNDTEIFSLENSKRKSVCVKMENAGGKVTFYASLTTPRDDRGKGFRLRYAAVDRSQAEGFCSSNWDISAKGEAGRIDLSWKPPPKKTKSGYIYLVVHKSSANDVRANLASLTSVVIDNLDPSTEYSIRVIAIPLAKQHNSALYSCSKRVRTKKEQARVTSGKSASEGYVQVYHAGKWTRVCGNYWWDINDANVACRSMSLLAAKHAMVTYPKIIKKNQQVLLGNSLSKVWLSSLQCTGREKSLLECPKIPRRGWTKLCYNDAGLVCQSPEKLRLTGGKFPNEGRLEILNDDGWSTICGSEWDIKDATVACRELGLPPPTFAFRDSIFGYAKIKPRNQMGPVKCKGSEERLTDCPHKGWGSWINYRPCSPPAAVVCGHPKVTLLNISSLTDMLTSPGFPKLDQANYEWTFRPPMSNASVLLCIEQMDIYRGSYYPGEVNVSVIDADGKQLYSMANGRSISSRFHVLIESNPSKLIFWSPYTFDYIHASDKGFKMRYFFFDESCKGNWNISIRSDTGSIDLSWSLPEPKSSKFKYAIVYYPSVKNIKSQATNSTSLKLDILEPNTEYVFRLFAFVPGEKDLYFCTRRARTDPGKLRLTGGKFPNEGRLEILNDDGWSTICGMGWDIKDATVACRELGLPPATFALRASIFGYAKIKPRNQMGLVQCKGSEERLTDCPHKGWGSWRINYRTCPPPAAVVCGHPKVTLLNISSLTDMLTSPGFPKLDQANYEWTFRPPMSNASVLLCIEQLDIYRGSYYPGKVNFSVIDADGKQLYSMANGGRISRRIHVLIESNPSKLIFRSPYTFDYIPLDKGFKMRYFVFDESCKGNWNISIRSDSGSIDLSWSLPEPKSSKFKYAIVYYPSVKNIKSQATNSTSLKLDILEPNTEYVFRLFAFVPGEKDLYFCTRRVRTDQVMWRLSGGRMKNEGIAEVNFKGEWGQLCSQYIWTQRESDVLCRSLGLPKAMATVKHERTPNMKSWMHYFQCSGKEDNLQECPHAEWGSYLTCPTVPKVVCGSPKVERHNITDQAGFITSPGYPNYMLQAHHEWTFIPSNPNSKFLMVFLEVDLERKSGPSKLIVKNSYGRTILSAEDQKLLASPPKRFVIKKFPVNMTYLSSFTPSKGGKGMRMRYTFFDDSCSSNWTPEVKPGIGKLDVSWASQSSDSDYNYLIVYNTRANQKEIIVNAHSPGATIDYLHPSAMYKVTVLVLHKNDTVAKYCTRHVRTKAETFRIAGGRVPNEGRVEIYRNRKWGVVCRDDWDMDDAKVACREAGFSAPTSVFGGISGYNPFAKNRQQSYVLGPLQCKGFETSLLECPRKRITYSCKSWSAFPAGLVCGRPKECKSVLKDSQGTIQSERYFTDRKIVDCEWTITAPSNTSLIVLSLRNIEFSSMAFCSESSLSYIDSQGRVVQQICRGSGYKFVMTGFVKIRLFSNFRGSVLPKIKLDYFVSNHNIEDIVEAPNWNITAQSRSASFIKVTWPYYKPTNKDKSQNLNQVVKYVPVCVMKKNGRIFTTHHSVFSRNTNSGFRNLKYGEYTVYLLAYLGDSRNTPLTNWKKAARKSRSITLKTREGIPFRAPTNVTATATGTTSILVTWDPIPEEYANGIIYGYTVYKEYTDPYRGKVIDTFGSSVFGRNNTSYEITMAFSNTEYTFQVKGFTRTGSGPKSSKVSATTGHAVRVRGKYGYFQASNNALYPSSIHKVWKLGEGEGFGEVLVVFKAFDLESSHMCSNDYVKVTAYYNYLFGGKFCGKKSVFAVSVITKRYAVAHVTLHSNAAIEKSGFSAFFKGIDKGLTKTRSVWNLQVQNTSRTGAVVSWDIPAGNVTDLIVLYKESSVQYIWEGVKASLLDNSIILKDLVPAKQYHVLLVGSIFDVIEESKLVTFTTKGGAKLDAGQK